jgi:GTP-binding protein
MSSKPGVGKEYGIRVHAADFWRPADDFISLPPSTLPEIAFVGRSNVGKSTLVNSFCERRKLARTSKTPGRTQTFNFYKIEFEVNQADRVDAEGKSFRYECYFVDLPGFGYAKVAKFKKEPWKEAISNYLLRRKSLEGVLLLVDSRREPQEEECWIAELGKKGNMWVALTKADKLNQNERRAAVAKAAKSLHLPPDRIMLVSADKPALGDPRALRETMLRDVLSK